MAKFVFDGVENFFASIKERCADEEEYAAEILKARGFLLEDNALALSDNSHPDDARYLNELLTEGNLGEVKDGKIFISPAGNVENIFYSRNLAGGESCSRGESRARFVHDSFASKVPLRFLEPFVGRYVKAISACSVETCGSCDGNHPSERNVQRILIEFAGGLNALWHEMIFNRFLADKFKFFRRCPAHDNLKLIFKKADKWKAYTEFNRAAEFLYDNRIKIRQIRREASNGISMSMTRNLSYAELEKIFSARANELFYDFSFATFQSKVHRR